MTINKVFGIGLTSTGTLSLNTSLKILGFNTRHDPMDVDMIQCLANGMIANLSFLEQCDGVIDSQMIPFYPQFDEEYPGSKFSYTYREVEDWIASMAHKATPGKRDITGTSQQFTRISIYGAIQYSESVYRHRHRTHHLSVMDYFKDKDNLLVLRVCEGEGWEKLCPFLGVDIPDVKFPFKNKRR